MNQQSVQQMADEELRGRLSDATHELTDVRRRVKICLLVIVAVLLGNFVAMRFTDQASAAGSAARIGVTLIVTLLSVGRVVVLVTKHYRPIGDKQKLYAGELRQRTPLGRLSEWEKLETAAGDAFTRVKSLITPSGTAIGLGIVPTWIGIVYTGQSRFIYSVVGAILLLAGIAGLWYMFRLKRRGSALLQRSNEVRFSSQEDGS